MPTERPKTFRAYVSGGIPSEIVERPLGSAAQILALLDGKPGGLPGSRLPISVKMGEEEWQRKRLREFVTGSGYRVKKGDIFRLHANCLIYCEGTR